MLEDPKDLQTKIALLERDMSRVSLIIDKLDATIDKLSDFSSSIKELLAVPGSYPLLNAS